MKIKLGRNYWLWTRPLLVVGFAAFFTLGAALPLSMAFTNRTQPYWSRLLAAGLGFAIVAFVVWFLVATAVIAGPDGIRLRGSALGRGSWLPWDDVQAVATGRFRDAAGIVRRPGHYQVLTSMPNLDFVGTDTVIAILLLPFMLIFQKRLANPDYARNDQRVRRFADDLSDLRRRVTGETGTFHTYVLGELHGPVQRTVSDRFVGMNAYAASTGSGPFLLPSEKAGAGARRRRRTRKGAQ